MPSATPSFVVRNRHGTFYFRYLVPKIFAGYADKRFEIRRSLGTNLRSIALARARRILVGVEALMLEISMKPQTEDNPIEWLRKCIDELSRKDDEDRRARQEFFTRLLEEARQRLELPLEVLHLDQPGVGKKKKIREPRLQGLPATRISDAIKQYCDEQTLHWRYKTKMENMFLLDLLVEIIGDKKIGALTLEDMRKYKDAVFKFPKNRTKIAKYRHLSVEELLKMDIPVEERFGARNAVKYLSRTKTFLKWARLNGFMTDDIGSVLTFKLPEREAKKRIPFSTQDLRKIFASDEYTKGLWKHHHHFWLPLLGMFTGARLNELCQLHVEDLRRSSDIWVIKIRDGGDRQVKNDQSIRDVPVHQTLIDLGFINFVNRQKQKREERLFPQLKKGKVNGYGGSASKWFCDFQRRCGIQPMDLKREIKGFHSFRHTVATNLSNRTDANLHERVINELLGHEKGRSETMQTYAHKINGKNLHEAVNQIKYMVNLDHLKNPRVNPYLRD
ncbi:MAG TPA: tyrosine-type recombinase/integrase [Oligoflexia bacterium]|nr:tyrosine-type recombinase/integrase [Oligoflexia bacterium]HMP27310.1 tyrosine-type recombinase/integrase [Oligoflexia bacterium]